MQVYKMHVYVQVLETYLCTQNWKTHVFKVRVESSYFSQMSKIKYIVQLILCDCQLNFIAIRRNLVLCVCDLLLGETLNDYKNV